MTLPPLPMPNVEVISGHRAPFVSYDADQMREYGQQCREAALEEAAESLSSLDIESYGILPVRAIMVISDCNIAIRSLK